MPTEDMEKPIEEPIDDTQDVLEENEPLEEDVDTEETDDIATDDDVQDEPEYFESEKEYLESLGVGDFDGVNSLVSDYKEKLKKLKQYEAMSIDDNITPKEKTTKEEVDNLRDNMFSETFGEFSKYAPDEKTKEFYGFLGKALDQGMSPFVKTVDQQNKMVSNAILQVVRYLRDDSWNRLPNEFKNLASREQVDKIMDSYGFLDYRQGFNGYVLKNPNLLSQYAKMNEQKGIDKGRKIKFPKSNSPRRDKSKTPDSGGGVNIKKYILPDGEINKQALNRLPVNKRNEILDAIIERSK